MTFVTLASATVSTAIDVTFTLSGTNRLNFSPPIYPITITVVAAVAATPITASAIVLSTIVANSLSVTFSCDAPSVIYFQAGLTGIFTSTTLATIKTKLGSMNHITILITPSSLPNHYSPFSLSLSCRPPRFIR